MRFDRRLKYYFLKFVRLKGEPPELALGMALGIFAGMLPIMPFHMVLSVALAIFFKGSKITALIGAWISNPLTWYFIYHYNYRIGAFILGFPKNNRLLSSLIPASEHGDKLMDICVKITGAGSKIIGAFTLGGLIMGIAASVPSYFIFLKLFQYIKTWREKIREHKRIQREHQ
ncbi:DUF2062 domain-containing protein [Thermodesulfobacteriota bacterium]